ncbi:hypothetical protein OEZ85_011008 [Tetradesmus obliquus]|uniref:Uncharacterized protein n=1 Tax=Tetradesmus obliquus TaxID=3088 RepID=A0ABY8TPB7_TETOB|nr:hypothetical protein OEZ85_011008 [Tetradesmus obliquus]
MKIRGCFGTLLEANEQAKALMEQDSLVDIYVVETGQWALIPPDPAAVTCVEYKDKLLNDIMHGHIRNQQQARALFEQRKQAILAEGLDQHLLPHERFEPPLMSNLESMVRRNLAGFQQQLLLCEQRLTALLAEPASEQRDRAVVDTRAALKAADEAHVAYVLTTAPYVKEYFLCDPTKVRALQQPAAAVALGMPAMITTNAASGQCTWQVADPGQVQRRGSVFRRYMNDVEQQAGYSEPADPARQYEVCTDCEGAPCLVLDHEYLVCPQCGRCFPMDIMSYQNLSFEQQISNVVSVACYRRSNHFSEWLSKLQAREVTKIPDDVMTAVKVELKKHRLTEPAQVTQAKIKEILKRLKFSKFYEHVPSIHSIITKTSAPKFPPALEEKLKLLFDEIQEPFERFKGAKRSNMLSYGFLLYKFCELLGEDEYLPYLPLLKSTSKLWDCDQVWKKICADRQWEFVPTV